MNYKINYYNKLLRYKGQYYLETEDTELFVIISKNIYLMFYFNEEFNIFKLDEKSKHLEMVYSLFENRLIKTEDEMFVDCFFQNKQYEKKNYFNIIVTRRTI